MDDFGKLYSELPLIWTPEMRPPLYSGHFKTSQSMLPSANLPLKWGHPSNQDTLTGPKGGRIRGSPHFRGSTVMWRGRSTLKSSCISKLTRFARLDGACRNVHHVIHVFKTSRSDVTGYIHNATVHPLPTARHAALYTACFSNWVTLLVLSWSSKQRTSASKLSILLLISNLRKDYTFTQTSAEVPTVAASLTYLRVNGPYSVHPTVCVSILGKGWFSKLDDDLFLGMTQQQDLVIR